MRRDQPYHSLKTIKRLIQNEQSHLIEARAIASAEKCFSWGREQIREAILRLSSRHYYKTDPKYDNPKMFVDYYKAWGLLGENVYIHLRIEDEKLIICSFKDIDETC
jgi:Motility quorum-sensing regulator, toxin of MqsA